MIRRFVNILAVLSLILFVMLCASWVRSHWAIDALSREDAAYPVDLENPGPMNPAYKPIIVVFTGVVDRGTIRIFIRRSTDHIDGDDNWLRYPPGRRYIFQTYEPPSDASRFQLFRVWSTTPPVDKYGIFIAIGYIDEGPNQMARFTGQEIAMPMWPAILLAMLLPGWRLLAWQRSRAWRKHGGCAACGYNLTGNISGVCPECGNVI